MNKESRHSQDNVKKATRTTAASTQGEHGAAEEGHELQDQSVYPEGPGADRGKKKGISPMAMFGWVCVAAAIIAFVVSGSSSVDTSESAVNALKNKLSTGVSAGAVLLENDENLSPQDYTLTHDSDEGETKVWVWDYAAEDGDYVQVLVNGVPVLDSFMIKHKPRELTVPSVGEVQVKGIRDGGGGITYAIRYDLNGTSYFNGAPEGEFNAYTLVRN